jgi:hypothetical protein
MACDRLKVLRSASRIAVGQVFGVGVDGEAEQDELKQRDPDHHAKRQPIPAHLDELLEDDGAEPPDVEAVVPHVPGGAKLSWAPVHEVDEDVLEARGHALRNGRAGWRKGWRARSRAAASCRWHAGGFRRPPPAGPPGRARSCGQASNERPGPTDLESDEPGLLRSPRRRCPAYEQVAIGDVGKPMAALRLVHVVGGDEDGETFGGEAVKLLPELPSGLGVDARGGFVEQEQFGLNG